MNQSQSMAGLASLVQSRGRNGDSMLVHMTPGEVKGLQALALAHGGSLAVNPDTGLVEANFLKKLLPTLLGVGLNFLVPGLGALGSGLLVGGVEAARTGDIGKGLMAGLGAYGGAGLGSAVSGIGAAATDAGTKILAQEAGTKAAQEAVTNQIKNQAANQAATLGGRLSNFGAGAKELFTGSQNLGLSGFGGVKALGSTMGMPAISGLGMTAANAMSPDYKMPTGGNMEIDQSYYEGGDYDPVTGTFRQGQWRKGYPGFPPPGMAGGGVIPAPNGNYPLARPSESVGGYEMDIDTYTGEERFADGGDVGNSQNLQAYYQSLLAPPVQQGGGGQNFASYLQGLNQYITSPVEAPKPVAAPPPAGTAPPGSGAPIAGGGGYFDGDYFGGGMRWDANQGRFVADAPQGRPGGTNPFASVGNIDLSNFGNIDFSRLQELMGGMSGARGGNTFTPDTNRGNFSTEPEERFTADMGMDESGAAYNPPQDFSQPQTPDFSNIDFSALQGMIGAGAGQEAPTTPFSENYMPPADMGMGEVAYRGGSPSFDMTGGGREYAPPPEFSSGPIAPMESYTPQPQPAPQQPAFDMGGMDFSGLAGLGALSGMPPQMAQAPEMPQQPAFDYGSMMAQQPTPSFDMSGFGGGMDFGAMAQQPAPSFDMGGFGGGMDFGAMQQPAPSFDMGNFGGGAGMDFSGMNLGDMGAFAGGGSVEYAAAGKLLRGPGDGMSDSIKANISGRQEARLADGEFVIPADVVSHLGNGSTEAGSRKLYKMMADVRRARTGKAKQAPAVKVDKYMPG